MEDFISNLKQSLDALLVDINSKAEEVKVNFNSFKDVFGKELEVQTENLKTYRARLETKGKKFFNGEELVKDVKEEIDLAIKDARTNVDRLFDKVKDKVSQAK